MDQPLNDYLHPIYQYTYNENAYSNKSDARNNYHKDIGLYSIQRSKEYVKEGRPHMNSLSEREHINIPPIFSIHHFSVPMQSGLNHINPF